MTTDERSDSEQAVGALVFSRQWGVGMCCRVCNQTRDEGHDPHCWLVPIMDAIRTAERSRAEDTAALELLRRIEGGRGDLELSLKTGDSGLIMLAARRFVPGGSAHEALAALRALLDRVGQP